MTTKAYATQSATTPLAPFKIQRRDPGAHDVQIEILFCGVCHSDLHIARNEWQGTTYPCVPGHEIIGRVTKVGAQVSQFKKGDLAGVGCLVDSCRTCENCADHLEQFCEQGPIFTYNSADKHSGGMTYGGYSENVVVDEAFVLHIPENLDLAATAPLLCAGITTYSPLRHNNVSKGQKVGVVGLGGLGHMGVKLAKAMGAHVVVFTHSASKIADAFRLGADEVVNSNDEDEMKKHLNSFHFILDTVSAQHDINTYLLLLKRDGTLTQVGVPPEPLALQVGSLIFGRRNLNGSLIGGIKETQEMLDFCGEHKITADIELIPIQKINEAYDRLVKNDVKYRFVIDMASLQA
ncbi:MAG: NAD(P)-dependent alcohol dehydrogenase [Methylococcaceae bacterium]|nr:NAD(P)-dependent alcohol dehydrogenase [Methylococcaceae bacterium]MDP2393245.1 NAD(P)-dependent alcohol dehydrogenase [Methylococcaceae bacterium]MDP3019652.1 NAD(P)-dependent alcohol dehydrogenase [Methylococcaceae bacterium]MDP3389030.1 NAD(P)-dependent alcohol dehydrogenase [Methylococcaceae bacterium]MDZ4157516.1 NAD(P)-dependent alcohol dehydrogenase [Methylococcales bacterium]